MTDSAGFTSMKGLLSLALDASGAKLTGLPDGSEAITVVFSIESWRRFDRLLRPYLTDKGLSELSAETLTEALPCSQNYEQARQTALDDVCHLESLSGGRTSSGDSLRRFLQEQSMQLPSRYRIGQQVRVDNSTYTGTVDSICFSKSKVHYVVELDNPKGVHATFPSEVVLPPLTLVK